MSAKRRAELQEFCYFTDCKFSEILRHVPAQWLSLRPPIKQLLTIYPAVVSYFSCLRDCPRAVKDLMRLAPSDAIVDECEVHIIELCLFFAHNVLATFEKSPILFAKQRMRSLMFQTS